MNQSRSTYSIKGSDNGVKTRPAIIRYEGCPPSMWYGTLIGKETGKFDPLLFWEFDRGKFTMVRSIVS